MNLHSLQSLSYLDENVNMVRRELLDFLPEKHPLHTHKCFDDADFGLDIGLCNETRFQPWARVNYTNIYFTYEYY